MATKRIEPINLREAKLFIDGVQFGEVENVTAKFTPEVMTWRQCGSRSENERWTGYKITGTLKMIRARPFVKDMIKKYIKTGVSPKFTIQGIVDDPGSDYVQKYGSDTTTLKDCTFSGDIPLFTIDTAGGYATDEISFSAGELVA